MLVLKSAPTRGEIFRTGTTAPPGALILNTKRPPDQSILAQARAAIPDRRIVQWGSRIFVQELRGPQDAIDVMLVIPAEEDYFSEQPTEKFEGRRLLRLEFVARGSDTKPPYIEFDLGDEVAIGGRFTPSPPDDRFNIGVTVAVEQVIMCSRRDFQSETDIQSISPAPDEVCV